MSDARPRRSVRCAIYTRVSTDAGLEQEFNSLEAQYDASQAYIRSQAHAGWTLIKARYDDGGFSGGSTERPALQQLLADVRARKINVIVVYKVDRLTRSLADFAKLVELFDGHDVSFVSVTQQFNTTTSMGRLTLNVLLSNSITKAVHFEDCDALVQLVTRIVVHKDRLIVHLKSEGTNEASVSPDDESLTIPWQKPPSKKSRQILLPHNTSRSNVRPERFERRVRLVEAIARGRWWLDDVVSGRVTTVSELCARENCSVRQVNMTISLAFLAPNLVKAAVEGRLPRGIGIDRLRDLPTEWSQQFKALGLNPE